MLLYTLQLGLAGAVGTLLRAGCSMLASRLLGHPTPWATLVVNAIGSFAFGAIVALCRSRDTFTAAQETILLVGLLGGLTSYSTFAFHSAEMLSHGRFLTAAAYSLGTNLTGLAAVWAGLRLFGRAG
jgi:CrcB protein